MKKINENYSSKYLNINFRKQCDDPETFNDLICVFDDSISNSNPEDMKTASDVASEAGLPRRKIALDIGLISGIAEKLMPGCEGVYINFEKPAIIPILNYNDLNSIADEINRTEGFDI